MITDSEKIKECRQEKLAVIADEPLFSCVTTTSESVC
jgi:hypothetical protein